MDYKVIKVKNGFVLFKDNTEHEAKLSTDANDNIFVGYDITEILTEIKLDFTESKPKD